MDIQINKKSYKKKELNPLKMAIVFLVLTILLTGVLYIYNLKLESSNKELEDNITKKEKSISLLEKQPNIIAYSLYNSNKGTIIKMEDYSKISSYINHLLNLSRKYNVDFKGFKYSSGKLQTQVIATSDSTGINYSKTVNFIKNYRINSDLSALFNLGLVKSVVAKNDGVDNVFNINLELKDNISNIFEKAKQKKLELEKKKQEELENKQKLIKEKIKAARKKKEEENKSGTGVILNK